MFNTSTLGKVQVRNVQYQRTSELGKALNTRDEEKARQWIVKSTREFNKPTKFNAAGKAVGTKEEVSEKAKAMANDQRRQADLAFMEADKFMKLELERIFDFKKGRVEKYKEFWQRHGIGFACIYGCLYIAGLFAFWIMLHNKIIDKHSMFEVIFTLSYGTIEREPFFRRVDQWGDYIDFGFAFTLNELLDLIRLPICLGLFWCFRRMIINYKPGLFKLNAPEKNT